MPKTVRFSHVVETCGRPQVHTLWVRATADAELTRAREKDRVMTIRHPRGKTAFGLIGFEDTAEKNEQFLVFPKSLKRFAGARVIGVKFDQLDQPKLTDVDLRAWTAPSRSAAKKKTSIAPDPTFGRRGAPPGTTPQTAPASRPRRAPPVRVKRGAAPPPGANARERDDDSPLAREVRAALEELQDGKTVAAYRRLERALEK